MTYNDLKWLFHVKLGFPIDIPAVLNSEGSYFKDSCVRSNEHRPVLSAAKM